MKKMWFCIAIAIISCFIYLSINISNQIKEKNRQRNVYVQDSIDSRKWIVDTIIEKNSNYVVIAHNKFVSKLQIKYFLNTKPTFLVNDTIDNLIK